MARHYYVGWFLHKTLAHCNDIDGNELCSRVSDSHQTTGWSGEDHCLYGKTRQEAISRGWKICSSCDSGKNQRAIERVEHAIEEHQRKTGNR
jgi:hypothetical protein